MQDRVYTGDTLFIRGTGRTDFQNGDARAQYESIFTRLLTLPAETQVYPGHDYKGDSVSTIAEERAFNPRLQVSSADEYAELMGKLNLPNPKMMDVAVPANMRIGLRQEALHDKGLSLGCADAMVLVGRPDVLMVDLREQAERSRHGQIRGSVHAPYQHLAENLSPGGLLHELVRASGKRIVFYCAHGERSAMAVQAALENGLHRCCHIEGGLAQWQQDGGETVPA